MRLILGLPTDHVEQADQFVTGAAIAEMARHAESCGIDGVFVTDHPAPDDRWLAGGGHHALEPTVALSFAAAATSHLRLVTNIYVLAYRPPLLAAKTLATLDALSGGRLTVGIAAGYLRSEFNALGADFDDRGPLLDAALDVVKLAWTGESVVASGPGWSARGNTILPRPHQQPGPPIWIGGNSKAAMTRAVVRGDGWMPFPTPPGLASAARTAEIATIDDLARRLEVLDRLCDEHGRSERPTICFSPISSSSEPGRYADELGQLAALGVDWITTMVPSDRCTSRAEWSDAVSDLAGRIV